MKIFTSLLVMSHYECRALELKKENHAFTAENGIAVPLKNDAFDLYEE